MNLKPVWVRLSMKSTVSPSSIGPCSMGPNVLVYPEGVFYTHVKKEDVKAIFDEHLLGGRPLERLQAAAEVW